MKTFLPLLLTLSSSALASDTDGKTSLGYSGAASTNASKAVAHGVAASGKATLGVLAVPITLSGAATMAIGAGGLAVGQDLSRAAAHKPGEPLPVSDETISTRSPAEALRTPAQ